MTNEAESLGQRLRRVRLDAGLTQAALAAPKYTAAYVSTIEAGRRNPSRAAIRHLAKKLDVDEEELRSGIASTEPVRVELALQETYSKLFSGDYDRATEAFLAIEDEAQRLGLARLEAKALEGRAVAQERSGEPAEALRLFENALELLESEPAPLRAEAIAGLARSHQLLGNVRVAIHLLESYLLLLEREGLLDPLATMRVYSSMIWPLSELGLHEQAAFAAEQALRLETRVTDAAQVANMHLNVARQLLQQGRTQDSLQSLKRAEDLYRSLNWTMELARAYGNQAIVLAEKGDFEGARTANAKARELVRDSGNRLTHARALNELGRIERLAGDIEGAKAALSQALSLLQQMDVGELAITHRELGLCFESESDLQSAEGHLRTAITLFSRTDNKLEVASCYRRLGDVLTASGRDQGALEAYRDGLLSLEAPAA